MKNMNNVRRYSNSIYGSIEMIFELQKLFSVFFFFFQSNAPYINPRILHLDNDKFLNTWMLMHLNLNDAARRSYYMNRLPGN